MINFFTKTVNETMELYKPGKYQCDHVRIIHLQNQ